MNQSETAIGLLQGLAAITDEGLIVLDRDDRVLLASDAAGELLAAPVEPGAAFNTSQVDYRVLRIVQAAGSSHRMEQRELNIADRDLVVRALVIEDERVATIVT